MSPCARLLHSNWVQEAGLQSQRALGQPALAWALLSTTSLLICKTRMTIPTSQGCREDGMGECVPVLCKLSNT